MKVDQKRTFVTIFPQYEDFHFYKDPGQIPYRYSKLGYKSSILCFSDRRLLPLTRKYIELITVPSTHFSWKSYFWIFSYLIRNGRRISILNLFHVTWPSLLFATVYKMVHRRGFTYLKMDASRYSGVYPWEALLASPKRSEGTTWTKAGLKWRVKSFTARKFLVRNIDLLSTEDSYTCQSYENEFPFMRGKLITLYNGHTGDITEHERVKEFGEKENLILTVGRLGTYQKATEILLQSFRIIADRCDFDLHLAGKVDPSFINAVKKFQNENPDLDKRIYFHGELNKKELFSLYNRSKIFCLPSRYEGMAIVFPEAMYFRNVTVTTPYVSPSGLIKEFGLGLITESLGPETLAQALMTVISDSVLAESMAENAYSFSHDHFNWDNIVSGLSSEINSRQKK